MFSTLLSMNLKHTNNIKNSGKKESKLLDTPDKQVKEEDSNPNISIVKIDKKFFDFSKLREFQWNATYKYIIRLNENNKLECLSSNYLTCLEYKDKSEWDNREKDSLYTTSIKLQRTLECGKSHNSKHNGFDSNNTKGYWCTDLQKDYYNKFLCSDITNIDIAVYIEYPSLHSKCVTKNKKECSSYTKAECLALSTLSALTKTNEYQLLDLNYEDSILSSAPYKVDSKVYVFRDVFNSSEKELKNISANEPNNYWESLQFNNYLLEDITLPRDFSFIKYSVSIPTVGKKVSSSSFGKFKLLLKLNDRIISTKESIVVSDYIRTSITFEGIIKAVKMGKISLSIDVTAYGDLVIDAGKYSVYIEGY